MRTVKSDGLCAKLVRAEAWRAGLGRLLAVVCVVSETAGASPYPDRLAVADGLRTGAQGGMPAGLPLRLQSGTFLGAGSLLDNLSRVVSWTAGQGDLYAIVQFDRLPDQAARSALAESRVVLLGYLPECAFLARIPRGTPARLLESNGVRWIGALYPEDKLPPRLWSGAIGLWALREDGTADLEVKFFSDVPSQGCRSALTACGANVLGRVDQTGRFTVNVPANRLWELARLPGVRWVEEIRPPVCEFVDGIRTNTQASLVQQAPYALSGAGVAVGIWDVGLVDNLHQDFRGRITIAEGSSDMGVRQHATHVAGIVGADGAMSLINGGYDRQWRGIAPGVRMYSFDTKDSVTDHLGAIYYAHVVISQNSWGILVDKFFDNCDLLGDYSDDAPEYDQIVTGLYGGRVSVVFAAGNFRKELGSTNTCVTNPYHSIGPPGTAKNVITVGAINSDNNSMTSFSSWGPLDDGRLKPELVAPGAEVGGDHGVTATSPGNVYAVLIGSSMAAPTVSGAVALLVEDYRSRFNNQNPLPSTVRALLVHTAEDLDDASASLNRGPDYASGYGRLQIKGAIDQLRSDGFLVGLVGHGQTSVYTLAVGDDSPYVKITLAWDDPAGQENAAVALVNDLDLVVFDPEGNRRFPWTLNPGDPEAGAVQTQEDHLNVIEQVFADSGTLAGNWIVQVAGNNVPVNAPQRFTLVFSPATIPASSIVVAESAAFEDTTGGNGSGVLDPGEIIQETVVVRNTDGPTATGVSGRIWTDRSDIRVLQSESFYPDILPGNTGTNLTPFVYYVSKNAPCGTTFGLTHVTTCGDVIITNRFTRTVGLLTITNIVTEYFEGQDVPKPIPDNGSVISTNVVSASGVIRDVNATVRIDHTWLDDLEVVLEHRDDLAVTLIKANTLMGVSLGEGECGTGQRTGLDDESETPLSSGSAPFAGVFQPFAPLSAFDRKPLSGEWRLRVADTSIEDTGTLLCWGMEINYEQWGYVCQPFNHVPVAAPQSAEVYHELPLEIVLGGVDADEDPLTFVIATPPQHGVLTGLDARTGHAVYTPEPDYSGPDEFTFVVNDGATNSPPALVSLTVLAPMAGLSVVESTAPSKIVLGEDLTYTLTVTNAGPNAAAQALVVDTLPAGVELLSVFSTQGTVTSSPDQIRCELGELPAGAAAIITIRARPAYPARLTNTAVVSATELDIDLSNNTAISLSEANNLADLTLTATALPGARLVGSPIVYEVTVHNDGPHPALEVELTDDLSRQVELISVAPSQGTWTVSDGVLHCAFGVIDNQKDATLTMTVVPREHGVLTNAASAHSIEFDFTPEDNVAEAIAAVAPAVDVGVTATASPEPVVFGDALTYLLAVTNRGPSVATSVAVVVDLPEGLVVISGETTQGQWTWDGASARAELGELAVGASVALVLVTQPTSPGLATTSIALEVAETDINPDDDFAVCFSRVDRVADIGIAMILETAQIGIEHPTALRLDVTNRGPHAAQAVVVRIALPTGVEFVSSEQSQGGSTLEDGVVTCDLGLVEAGAGATVGLVVKPLQLGAITISATVMAGELDSNPADNSVELTSQVEAQADLSLSMTAVPEVVLTGEQLTYSIVVTNPGPSPATAVVVSNTLPAGVVFVSASSSQGEPASDGSVVTCGLGEIAPGTNATLTVIVSCPAPATLESQAGVAAAEIDFDPGNNSASVTNSVRNEANLSLFADEYPPTVWLGDTIACQVAITNHGPHTASGVVLTDTLPAGLVLMSASATQGVWTNDNGVVSFDIGELAPGTSVEAELLVQALEAGHLTNVVRVDGLEVDADLADNSAVLECVVVPHANLSVSYAGPSGPLPASQPFDCSFVVTNLGPSAATGVSLTSQLPPELALEHLVCSQGSATVEDGRLVAAFGELASGGTALVALTLRPLELGARTIGCAVSGAEIDRSLDDNSTAVTLMFALDADLTVTLTGAPGTVILGEAIVYTLAITNLSSNAATAVVATDYLPLGVELISIEMPQGVSAATNGIVTFDLGGIAPGEGIEIRLTVSLTAAGLLTNVITVTGEQIDPDPASNTATLISTAKGHSELSVSLAASPEPVPLGGLVTYEIIVTNAGPHAAVGTRLLDVLPAGVSLVSVSLSQGDYTVDGDAVICNLGELTAGGGASAVLNVRAGILGQVSNSVEVSSQSLDLNPADDLTITASTVVPVADVGLVALVTPPIVVVGQPFTYAVLVTNIGPSSATGVRLVDVLPQGAGVLAVELTRGSSSITNGVLTAELGELPARDGITLTLTLALSRVGVVTNAASVSATELDPAAADNSLTSRILVRRGADLILAMTGSPEPVRVGENLTYTIAVTNLGPLEASGILLDDVLPEGTEFIEAILTQGSFFRTGGTINCVLGRMGPGATAGVTLVTKAIVSGLLTNTATVRANEFDAVPENNTATTLNSARNLADLSLSIISSRTRALYGSLLAYRLAVTNAGPETASEVRLVSTFPACATVASVESSQGTYETGEGIVTLDLGEIGKDAEVSITISLEASCLGLLTNQMTLDYYTIDPNPTDNWAEAITEIVADANLALEVVASPTPAVVGREVSFALSVTNCGPNAASGVELTETLPDSLVLIAIDFPQGEVVTNDHVVSLGPFDLAEGATAVATIRAIPTAAGTVANLAIVRATEIDHDPSNNRVATEIPVLNEANLAIMASRPAGPAFYGQPLTYTLVVTNLGPHAATGVVLADELPAGLNFISAEGSQGDFVLDGSTCVFRLGLIESGTSASASLSVLPVELATLTNTVFVTSAEFDPELENNTGAVVEDIAANANLAVVEAQPEHPPVLGYDFARTLTVINLGPNPAAGVVLSCQWNEVVEFVSAEAGLGTWVADASRLVWDVGPLGVLESATIGLVVRPIALGMVSESMAVAGIEPDVDAANNKIELARMVLLEADLSATLAGSAPWLVAGDDLTYAIQVDNRGPNPADGVVLVDQLPPGISVQSIEASQGTWSISSDSVRFELGSLDPGTNATASIVVRASSAGILTNLVSLEFNGWDLSQQDNTALTVTPVLWNADLALSGVSVPGVLLVGGQVSCELTVTNMGPHEAPGVVLTNALPEGVPLAGIELSQGTSRIEGLNVICELGTLPAGAGASVTLYLSAPTPGDFVNAVTLTSEAADPDLANNSTTVGWSVYPVPEVEVTQGASPAPVFLSSKCTLTISVGNSGTSLAPKVTVLDAFSLNVDILSAQTTKGTAEIMPPGVICWLGDLEPGEVVTITIVVRALTLDDIVSQAGVFSPSSDPVLVADDRLVVGVMTTPPLSTRRLGNKIDIMWPAAAADFIIEYKEDIGLPAWTEAKNPRVIEGDMIYVTVKLSGTGRVYRLRKP